MNAVEMAYAMIDECQKRERIAGSAYYGCIACHKFSNQTCPARIFLYENGDRGIWEAK